jgi:site-specific recombinase XerD
LHIAEKLTLKVPEGPLFRNEEGNPWTKNAINCRLQRMKKRCGFKLMPYALRHTFATEALKNGVDAVTVAQLMGHRDLTMVARVYGHLAGADDYLQESLQKATAPKPKRKSAWLGQETTKPR